MADGSRDGFHPLRVAAVERLTADAVALTFDLPDELSDTFAFTPGQHLTLRRPDAPDLRRTYSLCSPVGAPLRVGVKRMEGGVFSTWAGADLTAGDVLEVAPPQGRFGPRLDPGRTRSYGLVAAGSGITPMVSIAATALAVEPLSTVTLLYGNRTQGDVMFADELADLKDRHPTRLRLVHVLSREEQAGPLLSGRLDPDRLRAVLAALLPVETVDEWFLCGPFGVVTGGRDVLLEAGAAPDSVHVELFHADPPPVRERAAPSSGASCEASVTLHGRTSSVGVPEGEAVLDAVLRSRPDAPYACKGGVCGTCRAQVTEGAVEMDVNYALEADELAAGVVLTCQSHPTTPTLRLAFL